MHEELDQYRKWRLNQSQAGVKLNTEPMKYHMINSLRKYVASAKLKPGLIKTPFVDFINKNISCQVQVHTTFYPPQAVHVQGQSYILQRQET